MNSTSPLPAWIRYLLAPYADFEWRKKVIDRVSTCGLQPLPPQQIDPDRPQPVVPDVLAHVPVTLNLNPDGTVYYEFQHIDAEKPPDVQVHEHSTPFSTRLPEEPYAMNYPFVSSNGRFVTIRQPDDQIYRVYTYEDGLWHRWLPLPGVLETSQLFANGWRNYQRVGQRIVNRTILVTVLFFLFIMLWSSGQ